MKPVHILVGRGRGADRLRIDVGGHGLLDEDPMNARILVHLLDAREYLLGGGVPGQRDLPAVDVGLGARLLFHPHVRGGGCIIAYQYYAEAGRAAQDLLDFGDARG